MNRNFALIIFSSFILNGSAQEIESALPWDAKKVSEFEERSKQPQSDLRSSSIELPLRDDFSQDHFPSNEFGYEVYWTNRSATRSMGYGIEAPNIGVLVFEGLDETGYPYDFSFTSSYGPADTLESVEVNLQDKEGVVLSFFYQPEGNGEFPDPEDSLILEFYHQGQDQWIQQWFSLGTTLAPFEHVYIEVLESGFLVDGFKFRFRNYATLSGSLDHWVLDYIFLGDNRSIGEVLIDVGFLKPVQTLLTNTYTAVPWSHYRMNTGALMLPATDVFLRNLNNIGAFIANVEYEVYYGDDLQGTYTDPAEPSVPASGDLGITEELNSSPNNFIYPPSVNDTCADFRVNFSFSTSPDQNSDNDLMRFTQRFRDYYAYDDGEPERGYGVANSPGADIAYRFETQMTDTVKAVDMYFLPVSVNVTNELFYLTVWDAGGSGPGEVIYQDATPRNPNYVPNRGWARYGLQDTLVLDAGTYYFGWVQPGTERLNIGNDKNINNNSTRLFFDIGAGWTQSSTSGSLLIRPVVSSLKPTISTSLSEQEKLDVKLWPLPADDVLNFQCECAGLKQLDVYDAIGRFLRSYTLTGLDRITTHDWPTGIYHLLFSTKEGTLEHLPCVITR
jgi:hypothetical protein